MFSGRKAELPLNDPIVCGSVRVDAGDMIIASTTGITVRAWDQCGEGDRRAG
jgi:regulator of RNase E activity RraA